MEERAGYIREKEERDKCAIKLAETKKRKCRNIDRKEEKKMIMQSPVVITFQADKLQKEL